MINDIEMKVFLYNRYFLLLNYMLKINTSNEVMVSGYALFLLLISITKRLSKDISHLYYFLITTKYSPIHLPFIISPLWNGLWFCQFMPMAFSDDRMLTCYTSLFLLHFCHQEGKGIVGSGKS